MSEENPAANVNADYVDHVEVTQENVRPEPDPDDSPETPQEDPTAEPETAQPESAPETPQAAPESSEDPEPEETTTDEP